MNFKAAEFMHHRCPVGSGPSGKTWPKCESAFLERTSVLVANSFLSVLVTILLFSKGFVKDGHPVPETYLSWELKRGSPDTMSTYMPSSLLSQYSFLNALSVPSFCVILYCCGVRVLRNSSSLGFLKSICSGRSASFALFIVAASQMVSRYWSRPEPLRYTL